MVKIHFFDMLLATEQLDFSNVALDRAETLLAQVRQGHSIGVSTESEEVRAQIAVYQARTRILNAQENLNVAQISLNEAMGFPLDRKFNPIAMPSLAKPDFNNLDSLRLVATQKNARLNQIALAKKAAEMRSTAERLSWLPSLDFRLDYLRENEFRSQVYDGWDENYRLQANLALTYDLFKGGSGFAKRDRTQAEANRQRHVLSAFKASLDREITVRKMEVDRLFSTLKLAEKTVELGRKDLELAEKRYRLGLTDIKDLLDARESFFEYQEAHSNASHDLQVAHAKLLNLLGQ